MPLIATRGAASVQGFGEFAQTTPANYIEDVFQTWLYTGNGSSQTITNNIDLSTKGGLVWIKSRSTALLNNVLVDTVRGVNQTLRSDSTANQSNESSVTAFGSTGFTIGTWDRVSNSGTTFASWTFREQPKFFDVVTFTGIGAAQQINHNLGSTPGCIIVKNSSNAQAWYVYHRSLSTPANDYLVLNTTAASATISGLWGTVNSTQFGFLGNNGENYVAYLFAHDAGGFGLAGDQNVISCGSYTGNGSATGPTINLGYEPQWVLIKQSTNAGTRWTITDNMRGFPVTSSAQQQILQPNTTEAEVGVMYIQPTSTGFNVVDVDADVNQSGATYIYVAIRRGPMETPTSATTVFTPVVRTGTGGTTSYSSLSFSPDLVIGKARQNTYSPAPTWTAKLSGTNSQLGSSSTNAETTSSDAITGWLNTGYNLGADSSLGNYNFSTTASNYVSWNFGRAPGFFDVVCYTGTGSARTISHGLSVAPELMIVKSRGSIRGWMVYNVFDGGTKYAQLDSTTGWAALSTIWNNTNPTASVFSVGTNATTNENGIAFIAHLFGSVAGVSKIGTYNGTGTTQQIDCGFSAGARFVLIKRRNSSGDWYVWDSARGIVAGNDPYILYNSTAVEVTSTDYIDTYSAGFEISSTAPAAINAVGGTYLYLAIA